MGRKTGKNEKILWHGLALVLSAFVFMGVGKADVKASIGISQKNVTIDAAKTVTLKVKGTKSKVTWKSENKKIATVSKKGKVKGISSGKTVIVATVKGKKLKCNVRVKARINKSRTLVTAGEKIDLKIIGANEKVVWTTSDKSVAKVNSSGKVRTYKEGKVTIKGVFKNKTFKCKINVWDSSQKENVRQIKKVFKKVNNLREKKGLPKYKLNYRLCKAATVRAKELSEKFSHTRPNGTSCFTVFKEYGLEENSFKGENIAYGYVNASKAMEGWLKSSGHKNNILSSTYQEIGIGMYNDDGMRYWVQDFYAI